MLVSGCNTTYRRPISPDTANVRAVLVQPDGWANTLALYAHPDGTCEGAEKVVGLGGPFNFGGGSDADRDIGMPRDPDVEYVAGQYFETSVLAGQRFHYTIVGTGRMVYPCYFSGSFSPRQGADYEMSLRIDSDRCTLRIERLVAVDAGSGLKRVFESSSEERRPACTAFWN
jgi:hypothetical protein